ncbi:MAG: transglutaminase domain-containing protein, partial [Oscillospiraceae bacterium]|nr:transglutaminase domain-containing protein [Oscillospiraceae bacterium]
TIKLSDNDIKIIEQFAAEHFPENSTMAEKLYITHQWIHKNVDYAYAGAKWNAIVNKSYVDAIFNYKSGQCVQYNGAMASVLAYYGYDVYMVRGWTRPGVQHYWTECNVAGKTYLVECGNLGKNGDSWQYFFKDYPNPGAYQ